MSRCTSTWRTAAVRELGDEIEADPGPGVAEHVGVHPDLLFAEQPAGGTTSSAQVTALKATTSTWAAATTGATTAADLQLAGGRAILDIGGWNGQRPLPHPRAVPAVREDRLVLPVG